jgi:hypothetical protein
MRTRGHRDGGAWSPEGAAWAISSAAPGTPLFLTRPGGHTNPSGEAGLSAAAADVTTAAWLAFFCPSMVRCSWSTTGRDRALTAPKGWPSARDRADPEPPGPAYDPGAAQGEDASGVVAHSEVDAVPSDAGQGGGPVMRHDGGHRGVNPAGRVFPLLGQPSAAGILPEDGVADVAGEPAVSRVGELPIDDGFLEAAGGRRHPPG